MKKFNNIILMATTMAFSVQAQPPSRLTYFTDPDNKTTITGCELAFIEVTDSVPETNIYLDCPVGTTIPVIENLSLKKQTRIYLLNDDAIRKLVCVGDSSIISPDNFWIEMDCSRPAFKNGFEHAE